MTNQPNPGVYWSPSVLKKIVLIGALVAATAGVVDAADTDEWHYQLTPYLWLPVIDGQVKYGLPPGGGGGPEIEVGPTDWLDLLNFGLLLNGSARKGRYSVSGDLVYLSMTSKNDGRVLSVSPGNGSIIPIGADLELDTRTDLDGLLFSLNVGYTAYETDRAIMDVFVGARFLGVDLSSRWDLTTEITTPSGAVVLPSSGDIGADKDLWDGVVGVRGRARLGDGNWSLAYSADLGAGSSDFTWNAYAALSYAYGWGDLLLAYRHLAYDQDADSLLQDFSFSGPAFGATFRF